MMGNTVNSREPVLGLEPIDPLTNLNLNPTRQSISGSLSAAYGSPTFHQGSIPASVRRIMGDNYHPEYGPNFVNEQLAANQTKGGQLFNAMSQAVVGQILGGAIQGVGYLLDLESIGNLITGRSDDFTNSISEIGLALQNKVQDAAPIYRSADAKKFDIGSFSWWMQNAPSLVSTVSLMFPAMGIVRGLEAVAKLAKIGEGIAVAFVATIYGLLIANIFGIPFGTKLKRKAGQEAMKKEVVKLGVIGIQEGLNPHFLKERLEVYVEEHQIGRAHV